MTSYKIMHKDPERHIIFASGSHSLERGENWIKNFNPQHYTDKTLRRENLIILPESERKEK